MVKFHGKIFTSKQVLSTWMWNPNRLEENCGYSELVEGLMYNKHSTRNWNFSSRVSARIRECTKGRITLGIPSIMVGHNFDQKKENSFGSIHTCHGMEFTERSGETIDRSSNVQMPRTKRRTIDVQPKTLSTKKKEFRTSCDFIIGVFLAVLMVFVLIFSMQLKIWIKHWFSAFDELWTKSLGQSVLEMWNGRLFGVFLATSGWLFDIFVVCVIHK